MDKAEDADSRTNERIARMLSKVTTITADELRAAENTASKLCVSLESQRSFERHVVVLDMDSFYAR